MPLCCTVCGEWSPALGPDRLDICRECWRHNFAGNPLEGPTSRAALEAYVNVHHPLTPRQLAALAFIEARWAEQAED